MYKLHSSSATESNLDVHIHGWDSTGWFWHEPAATVPGAHETSAILQKLSKAPGAFHGTFRCRVPGSAAVEFQTTAYDLKDSGLAVIHLDGVPGGPIGALTIIPAQRRPRLRKEFAFGFVAHLSFFDGLINPESELAIHDYVDTQLQTEPPSTLVFTVETARVCVDVSIALSAYLERLSIAMLHWLCAKDAGADAAEQDVSTAFLVPEQGLCAGA